MCQTDLKLINESLGWETEERFHTILQGNFTQSRCMCLACSLDLTIINIWLQWKLLIKISHFYSNGCPPLDVEEKGGGWWVAYLSLIFVLP